MHVIYKRCHLVEGFETSSKFYWSVQHSALGSAVPLAMFDNDMPYFNVIKKQHVSEKSINLFEI